MSTSIPEQQNPPQPTGSVQKTKPRTKTHATKARHKATRATKGAKACKRATPGPRTGSKTAKALHLLQRSGGATLHDLIAYASHCTSLGRCEGFSLTKGLFDNLTPLPFCGGLGPGFS